MRKLTTCRHCGRYIAPDFRFCPYCGTERVRQYEFRHILDTPFERMEKTAQEYSFRKLVRLEEWIASIESDLESMLSGQGGADSSR